MSLPDALALLAAGVAAGAVNAIVGSGSLITFPVLLAIGQPAVTANVSNTVGLVSGNLSADWCSSPPRFVGNQLWVTCMDNGFMVLQFTNGAYSAQ